jgi:DNA polymerase (family 10)
VTALRRRAADRGLRLDATGLYSEGESHPLRVEDEAEIYHALELQLVPPELRENRGEIEAAAEGRLPELVTETDLEGLIHVHTTYSDGRATLEQMVEAARGMGYSYLGVADHSESAFYAGGLKEREILKQHAEIDRLNASLDDFRIFKGIESDIRPDGSLDYRGEVLDRFDFVIASVHSRMGQPEKEMTERVIRALKDPHTTFLGHPTGRLLLQREEMAIDMEAVLHAAARLGVAVEINANPRRLDLDWRHGPLAREIGLLVSIHPDAHGPEGIADNRYGVGIARKAGFAASQVVSTWSAEKFAEFLSRRKGGRGPGRTTLRR